ncbi:hypothetical protein QFZ21_000702 [Microbacterium sp. W4I20]|nr:hypothetical protein [Microbacterium sp. W4I20]
MVLTHEHADSRPRRNPLDDGRRPYSDGLCGPTLARLGHSDAAEALVVVSDSRRSSSWPVWLAISGDRRRRGDVRFRRLQGRGWLARSQDLSVIRKYRCEFLQGCGTCRSGRRGSSNSNVRCPRSAASMHTAASMRRMHARSKKSIASALVYEVNEPAVGRACKPTIQSSASAHSSRVARIAVSFSPVSCSAATIASSHAGVTAGIALQPRQSGNGQQEQCNGDRSSSHLISMAAGLAPQQGRAHSPDAAPKSRSGTISCRSSSCAASQKAKRSQRWRLRERHKDQWQSQVLVYGQYAPGTRVHRFGPDVGRSGLAGPG